MMRTATFCFSKTWPHGVFVGLLVMLGLAMPALADVPIMSLPGSFSVNQTGAAVYQIPIDVPPGTAGMNPSLTLEYSSQGSNGIIGMGWMLGGLPSITRCPQTMAQDGVVGSVTFTASDRFCMEGQRLIAINGGTYGANGTQYRTEIEGFSNIVSYGTAGTGPAYFQVWTKAGQILQLGNSATSAVLATGTTTVQSWAVNQITDTTGNYLTVTYSTKTATSDSHPVEIDYTGNPGNPATNTPAVIPYNSVKFLYNTSRPDIWTSYQAGSVSQITSLLTDIKTYSNGNLVSDYSLVYGQGPTTARSVLTSVKRCGSPASNTASPLCLPATTFTYQSGGALNTISNAPGQNNTLSGYRAFIGNFFGNGRNDILWDSAAVYDAALDLSVTTGVSRVLWKSNGDGSFTSIPVTAITASSAVSYSYAGCGQPLLGDFFGHGLTDILWVCETINSHVTGDIALWKNNGDGSFTITDGIPAPPVPSGLASSYGSLSALDTLLRTGYTPVVGDFNGDGKSDVFWYYTGLAGSTPTVVSYTISIPYYTWLSNGDGTFKSISIATGAVSGTNDIYMAGTMTAFAVDINGDGKSDIFWNYYSKPAASPASNPTTGGYEEWLSNGDGTFRVITAGGVILDSTLTTMVPQFGDFNGDGIPDIFWDLHSPTYGGSSGNHAIWFGAGDGTFVKMPLVGPYGSGKGDPNTASTSTVSFSPSLGDFSGSGRTDILWTGINVNTSLSNGTYYLYSSNGDGSFRVSSPSTATGLPAGVAGYTPLLADFTGHGKMEVLWDVPATPFNNDGRSAGTSRIFWTSDGIANDLMQQLAGGLGAGSTIVYQPLTNSAVYTKGTGAIYPQEDVNIPLSVVSQVNSMNGIGGYFSSGYTYSAMRVDLQGRGFLGMGTQTVTDLQTNLAQTTNYFQGFPLTGLESSETKVIPVGSSSVTLSSSTTSYLQYGLGGTRYFVAPQHTVVSNTDLDGSAMPTTTTCYQYDNNTTDPTKVFGEATQVTVAISDRHTKTTANAYGADNINLWLLGRLTQTTVTSTTAGSGTCTP